MNKTIINTDKVVTTIKKSLYDLKDIDHESLSNKEKKAFKKDIEDVEDLAHAILAKIKNI